MTTRRKRRHDTPCSQDGWRQALRSGRAGVLIKRPDAANMFSMLVVSDSGKGRVTTVT